MFHKNTNYLSIIPPSLTPAYSTLPKEIPNAMKQEYPHCFVVLEKTVNQKYGLGGGDLIHSFIIALIKYKNHFDFLKTVDVNLDADKDKCPPPEGITPDMKDFTKRYTAKFTLSIDTINKLLENTKTTDWHGRMFDTPGKLKMIENTLKNNLVGLSVDLKNESTKEWDRYETFTLQDCQPEEKKTKTCCNIL
jgi:hypothetical protein